MVGNLQAVFEDGNYVVLFSGEDSAVANVAARWCQYTKRELLVYGNPEDYEVSGENLPVAALVDSSSVSLPEQMPLFEKITGMGIPLIFCNLPDPEVIRGDRELMELLGIRSVREDEVRVEGIHLFGGFLLGGESFYKAETREDEKKQDLDLDVPWYINVGGTKTYMVGMLDELLDGEEAKNEYFPGLIWRNGYNGTHVFVVNGDYLESMMGVGILDAMLYEAEQYAIYPIINAQNVTVANFPGFAGENEEQMLELYSRQGKGLLRDVCWPALSGLAKRNQYHLTCLMQAQYDYTDGIEPSGDDFSFYLQQFREADSEAGISLTRDSATDLGEKLKRDEAFFSGLEKDYAYSAVFAAEEDLEQLADMLKEQPLLENVRTVASPTGDSTPVVDYYTDEVTLQSITALAETHTYSDDLWLRAIETALGYSNVLLDMQNILYPKSEDDRWERAAEGVFSNLDTYWKAFTDFDQTTLSESDSRVRGFLNLDYRASRREDTIYLELRGVDSGWFLLRTHGEKITRAEGAEYLMLETDSYLVQVLRPEAEIYLEKSRGIQKYTM